MTIDPRLDGGPSGVRRTPYAGLPLVYACSGCSSAAQLANTLALRLDRECLAEMSCIAGVGGDVPALVRKAQSRRRILALDGCPLHCVRHCLERQGVSADLHLDLSQLGVRKRLHVDASPAEAHMAWETAVRPAIARLQALPEPDDGG